MEKNYKIFNGDARLLLKEIPDESIDCIITDPPYETIKGGTPDNKDVQRPSGILSKNDGKIFQHNDIDISAWIEECYRVLKEKTHLYIMTNFLNLSHYMQEITNAGFYIHNLLVWKKNNATPNRWYMKNCEYIIFARKGSAKPINDCGSKTVLEYKNVTNKIHPTEKPLDLLKLLITNSSSPGNIILDPFGGSFSTAAAAILCGRQAISFEIDKEYFDLGQKRLENIDEGNIVVAIPKEKKLTPNQKTILEILEKYPDKDFSGKELSKISGLSSRTCSGCITPLCSSGFAKKTTNNSPYRIQYKRKEEEI